jgi:undecaprenyl-diphosphatase
MLAVATLVLTVSAFLARGGRVSSAELTIFRAVNDLPGWLYAPVFAVMQFGNGFAIVVVALLALFRRRFRLAAALAASGLSVYLAAKVLKGIVLRGRPPALVVDLHVRGALTTGHGFPSGHASVAFALATVAWLWFGRRTRWWFLAAAVVVCIARVYVGAHFPLDVLGGAALGMASGALVGLLLSIRRNAPSVL